MSLSVETIINNKLDQFTKLGQVAKKIQNNHRRKKLLHRIYIGMTRIALDLALVKDVIFEQQPDLMPLMDSLIELYGPEINQQ